MTEPLANKIGVVNQGTIDNQTNNITIHEGLRVALIYSDPLPDLRFFQGRATERADLDTWLVNQDVSVIGIQGEGGIGKSTLVAKAFAECKGYAGKFWADVRTGTSITVLASRALQELGVPPDQVRAIEEKDLIPRLLRHLQSGRYLLAIDNLESLLSAMGEWQSGYEAFWDGFQEAGSASVLLLGSREYPPKYFGWRRSRWLRVEQGLKPAEGAALLAALEVEDTDENRAAVSEKVQGNPLALSLIAGWLRQEYRVGDRRVEHLQQHSALFQLEGKHRGEANISVDWVLQWSFDRISLTQQHLLSQVSVLRGAFTAAIVAALLDVPSVEERDMEDLERRSLLQLLPERDQSGLHRFRLQPRLREFVQRHSPDLSSAHERAIHFFWNQRQIQFAPDDTLEAVAEYEETFYHQCQLGRYIDAVSTAFACHKFLRRRGYYQTLIDFYQQLHTIWHPNPEQQQSFAAVCNTLGIVYHSLGQYQRAINFHQQFLVINRDIGNQDEEAISLNNLGIAYDSLGQYQRAIDSYQQSLAIKRNTGDLKGEAISLDNLGMTYRALEQYQQAIDFHQQSLAIYRDMGDREKEAISLTNLGMAYRALGRYQQAIDFYQQSLVINRDIGNQDEEAISLNNLGIAYDSLGQYQRAIDIFRQSLAIYRDMGDPQGEEKLLINLGNTYQSLGQYQEAIDFYRQSLAIARDISDYNGEGISLFNIGNTLARLDQQYAALQSYRQALTIYEELKLDHMIERCKTAIAERNRIIPIQQRTAPTIGEEKQSSHDCWERSVPNPQPRLAPLASRQPRQRWQTWGLGFAAGIAIVLLIWWLKQ